MYNFERQFFALVFDFFYIKFILINKPTNQYTGCVVIALLSLVVCPVCRRLGVYSPLLTH
jgi:hypothetical protein